MTTDGSPPVGGDWSGIDTDATITLVVSWKVNRNVRLGQLPVGKDVADELRKGVVNTLGSLAGRDPAPWTPDADLTPEAVLYLPMSEVGDEPTLVPAQRGQGTFLEAVRNGAAVTTLDASSLPTYDLAAYAVVLGDNPEDRVVLIRRANARRGLRRGRLFTALRDSLVRLDEPLFAFDDFFDLVLIGDRLYVLSQTAFVALFRGNASLSEQVPRWVGALMEHLTLVDGGAEKLIERARRDSRIRTRLEAIAMRGHLADVKHDRLREAMIEHGLSPDDLLDADDRLIVTDDNIPGLLQFLNEDLFVGSLSESPFRADKKSQR